MQFFDTPPGDSGEGTTDPADPNETPTTTTSVASAHQSNGGHVQPPPSYEAVIAETYRCNAGANSYPSALIQASSSTPPPRFNLQRFKNCHCHPPVASTPTTGHQNYVLIKKCRQCHRQIKEDPEDSSDGCETNFCNCLMQNEVQRAADDLDSDDDDDDDGDKEILVKPAALEFRNRQITQLPSTSQQGSHNKFVMDIGMVGGSMQRQQHDRINNVKEIDLPSNKYEPVVGLDNLVDTVKMDDLDDKEATVMENSLLVDETGLPSYSSVATLKYVEKHIL